MTELIRDTTFGHIVRLLTNKRFLRFSEEADPSLWKRYINEEASGNAAHHGTVEKEDAQDKDETMLEAQHSIGGVRTRDEYDKLGGDQSSSSSEKDRTHVPDDGSRNIPSGVKVDPEKGRDLWIVDWNGPNDPEVSNISGN